MLFCQPVLAARECLAGSFSVAGILRMHEHPSLSPIARHLPTQLRKQSNHLIEDTDQPAIGLEKYVVARSTRWPSTGSGSPG
jgi:hypothetical protein